MKRNYTVKFTSDADKHSVMSAVFNHLKTYGIIEITDTVPYQVIYPDDGARNISSVRVEFEEPFDKNAVEAIVEYWTSLPFVTSHVTKGCDFIGNSAYISVNCISSHSHDIDKRGILELLGMFLTEGTPERVDGSRAVKAACKKIYQIVGLDE